MASLERIEIRTRESIAVRPAVMALTVLRSVGNTNDALERASEARERATGTRDAGQRDSKESTRAAEGKENGDVDDVLSAHAERALDVCDVSDGNDVEGTRGSEADMSWDERAERSLEAGVVDVVGEWLNDVDAIAAEADRACGMNLQALYAPLRGDETLDRLRGDKSALKRRLRQFDVRVLHTTGRKTTREDKRHLRPLYVRLAKIKDLIAIREVGG